MNRKKFIVLLFNKSFYKIINTTKSCSFREDEDVFGADLYESQAAEQEALRG